MESTIMSHTEGNIWKENTKFLDISIKEEHLNGAQKFLKENHVLSEVLHSNIQDLIDGQQSTDEKRSSRISKL